MDPIAGLIVAASTLGLVVAFALVVRRVLGVPVSLVRATVAALVAAFAARPLLNGLLREPSAAVGTAPDTTMWLYLTLLAVFAVVLAMLLLVIAEMVIPDGSLPGPLELWRGWRSRLARGRRYAQIVAILASRGLSRFLRGRRPVGAATGPERRDLARSLRKAMEDGGVTFVKLGQQLSTRRDLLPPEFVDELSQLQDAAPRIPWEQVRSAITEAWGHPPQDTLATLEQEPLGSASIAQVHAATLHDGTAVVVKVQRPGIEQQVLLDLDILRRLAATLATRTDWAEQIGLTTLADGFSDALREELDFTIEARNTGLVAAELAGTDGIRVARVFPEHSTERVLVMERMPGVPLNAAEPLLARLGPQRRREIADTLVSVVMSQVLRTGVFHVDLHPGNVLVDDDGVLSILDLGSVGRLGSARREAMSRLFLAIGTGSSQAATDALLDVVDRPEDVDERALEQSVGDLILRFSAGGTGAAGAAFASLFRLVSAHRLGIPPAVAAVFRAIATLEGTLSVVDPGYDLTTRVSSLGREEFARSTDPAGLRDVVERELLTVVPVLQRLPRRLDRVADAAEHGRLSFGVRLLADRRERELLTSLWHQTLLTALAATSGVMAALLLSVGPGPLVTEGIGIFWVLGGALLCISVILALRVLMSVLRRRP